MITAKNEFIDDTAQHRDKAEYRMAEDFPVEFARDGDAYRAQLTDLSFKGAHLRIDSHEPVRGDLFIGEELHLSIFTPYGSSNCTAKIMWIEPELTPLSIGVEFTALSADPKDPLRCCIDSPF